MSRMIEDYVCASEDRVHYNLDDECLRGFHRQGMIAPHVITYNITNKTEIIETVSDDKIKEVVETMIPGLKEDIHNDIVNEIEEIDEIYGGSATEVLKEPEE